MKKRGRKPKSEGVYCPFRLARKHRTEAGMIQEILRTFPKGVRFNVVLTGDGYLTATFPYPGNPHYSRQQIAKEGYYVVNI